MSTELFNQITEAAKSNNEKKDSFAVQTKSRVRVSRKSKGQESEVKAEDKILSEKVFEKEPPRLWIDYGITKSIAPYESAKISIGLSLPVGSGISEQLSKEIQQTKNDGMKILESMIEEEIRSLDQWIKEKKEQDSKGIFG